MFNLQDYETVAERLEKFWKDYPDGRVQTEIIFHSPSQYIVKACIYKNFMDVVAFADGLAEETVSDKGVNRNFALPNAETSAIGRALANGNITTQAKGFSKGKRPSREEMTQVLKATMPDDPWGLPPQNQAHAPEPAKLADGIEIVAEILGGEPVEPLEPEAPTCKHGTMQIKRGEKNGKPYLGYVCFPLFAAGYDSTEPKCPAMWAKLIDGRWVLPKESL